MVIVAGVGGHLHGLAIDFRRSIPRFPRHHGIIAINREGRFLTRLANLFKLICSNVDATEFGGLAIR